jgi:hypothetical protein
MYDKVSILALKGFMYQFLPQSIDGEIQQSYREMSFKPDTPAHIVFLFMAIIHSMVSSLIKLIQTIVSVIRLIFIAESSLALFLFTTRFKSINIISDEFNFHSSSCIL